MLFEIAKDFILSRKAGKGLKDRWSAFKALLQLRLKSTKNTGNITEYSQRIFGWTIYGYNYKTMLHVFKEVFIFNDYMYSSPVNNPVIFDCGANIGCATFYLKKLYPSATITCFEANPYAYKLLEKNISANNLKGVTAYNVALASKSGEISFYTTDHQGSLVGSIIQQRGGGIEMKVKSEPLSAYVKQAGKVDLLKMDVEGSETDIINEMESANAFIHIEEMLIEYHHNIKDNEASLAKFLGIFEQHGYIYNLRTGFKQIGEMQDILIHLKKKRQPLT